MNKKLLSLIALAGLFVGAGCSFNNNSTNNASSPAEKYSSTVLANTENTYVLHGQHMVGDLVNGWNGKSEDLYKATTMTATSFAGISEISTEVADLLLTKDVKYLYTIEATFGVNDANWGDGSPFAMIDGKRYQVNGSYAFKVTEVSYDAEDEVYAELKWLPDPHKYHVESLTADTLFMPRWTEEVDENGFSWGNNPVCIGGAGTYKVIFAEYNTVSTSENAGYGVALVKTAEGVAATENVQIDYTEPEPAPEPEAWVAADHTYGLIGTFNSWGGDVAMTENNGVWSAEYTFEANAKFKVRADGAWDVSWGAEAVVEPAAMKGTGDIVVAEAGTYNITISNFTAEATAEIRVTKVA